MPALCPAPEYLPEHGLRCAAWLGGAVLSKIVFDSGVNHLQQAVTKADYDEAGPAAVRRCS